MEVRISRDVLLNGVHKVQGIVEPKGAMPILSHLHLSAEKDGICIRATDLEIGTLGSYPANVTTEGAVTLNARKLFDIIKELPNEEIYIKKEENNWITLKCGKSKFRLPGLPPEDYPPMPEYSDKVLVEFDGNILKEMIRKTRDEVGTAPKQDFLANVRASVSYLYPDNDLQDKVQNSYKKSAIKFVLILGLLIVLNYLFSFATLAVIVLNFVIGMANLILPAHIQLLQVLVLPMLTSFCLNVGLVLCLSCLVYDASVALAKDSAEEQDLLWLYSIGIKGKADTVYMLADALFYRTTMPFFASYFAGYGVVEVAVNAGQAVKPVRSSGISEGTNDDRQKEGVKSQSADSLVDRYEILRKARCIRHQDCHTASGGRSSAQKP